MVEGYSSARLRQNETDNGIKITKHIAGRDPKRPDARPTQGIVAGEIALGPIGPIVRLAVDLDRQRSLSTEEVDHERAKRMLPAKLQSIWTLAKNAPQQNFWQAHLTPKFARSIDRTGRPLRHRSSPSTMLFMVPLPEQTRGEFRA
jgi:hypothetical protein